MRILNIFLFRLSHILYFNFNSIGADESCGGEMLAVNARAISGKVLQTRAGITDGLPFLQAYLNHARFVREENESCVIACFW